MSRAAGTELRVTLSARSWEIFDECKEMANATTDAAFIAGALPVLLAAYRQITGGLCDLAPEDLLTIDGLLRRELRRVKAHVHDPTTPADEPRKINLILTLTPDASRERLHLEPSAGSTLPKTQGKGSMISIGSANSGEPGSPVQLEIGDGGGPDWFVATDGERFEAHPTDAELFPGWIFHAGPFKRPEAELQSRRFNGRGAADVFGDTPPTIWPVIIRGALPPVSPPSPPKGNGRRARGSAGGEAGGKARKGKA